MPFTKLYLIVTALILLITACAPQSAHPIEATTIPSTDVPTAHPTLAPSATFRAPVASSRTTMPPVLDFPTETPTPSPTPDTPEERYQAYIDQLVRYLTALCSDQRDPTDVYEDVLKFHALSPDGQLILFVVPYISEAGLMGDDQLWVVNADGTNLRLLYEDGGSTYQVVWLPNTHQIAFNTGYGRESYGPSGSYNDLHVIDADTGEHRVLLPARGSDTYYLPDAVSRLYPSPDAKQIAMVSATSISLIAVDGSSYQRDVLLYDLVLTYSEYNIYARPVWSADSSGVWIAVPPLFEEAFIEVYFASLCCGLRQAGSFPMDREDDGTPISVYATIASPTGEHVAYERGDGMHIARVDGSEDVIVYHDDDLYGFNWLDATRYQFYIDEARFIGEIGGEPQQIEADPRNCASNP